MRLDVCPYSEFPKVSDVTADACLMRLCKDVVYPRFKPARNAHLTSIKRFEWRFLYLLSAKRTDGK